MNALKQAMEATDAAERTVQVPQMDQHALRAIAHNAVYEAMLMRGRVRFSPRDAQRADIIYRALADTPASTAADLERTAVIPVEQAGSTALLSNIAHAVDALNKDDGSATGQAA